MPNVALFPRTCRCAKVLGVPDDGVDGENGDGEYYGDYDPDEPDFLSSHADFYPPAALLEELGRVVVASSRLEFIAHRLWVSLQAPHGSAPADLAKTRRIPGSELIKNIRARVSEVVHSDWREDVLADLDRAADAEDQATIVMALRYRNADIHSAWMMKNPPEVADPEDGRRSVEGDWWLIANDEDHAEPAPSVERLRKTEEACREGARQLLTLADDLSYKRMAKGSRFVTVGADTLVQMYEPGAGMRNRQ